MWLPCKWNVAVSYTIIITVIVTTQMFRMWPETYPNHWNFIEIQLAWHCSIYCPVSPVERVLICCAGGSEFKLQPDHEPRSLKHWWDHPSCDLNPFPVQMVMSLGSNNKPLALSPSSLHISWKGMLKNLWHCVHKNEKGRRRRPQWNGLSDLCRHWPGWMRWDQTWTEAAA